MTDVTSNEIMFAAAFAAAVALAGSYLLNRTRQHDRAFAKRAEELAREGEHEEAVDYYDRAIEANASYVIAYLGKARSLARLDRLEEAVDVCRRAVKMAEDESDKARALSQLGELEARAGRFDQAHAAHTEILELRPDDAYAAGSIAHTFWQQGRLEEALAVYEELYEREADPDVLCNMGEIYADLGRPEEAIEACSKALTWLVTEGCRPASSITHTMMVLGEAHAQCGQFEQAFEAFSRVAGLQPDWPAPMTAMGDAWARAGKTAEAIEAYRKALELDDQWEDAWRGLGIVLTGTRNVAEARAAFDKAIEANASFPAAHVGLGKLLIDIGQPDHAAESLAKAVELDPHGPTGKEARALLEGLGPEPLVDDVSPKG